MGVRLLLDTSVVLWALLDPGKLSARAEEMLSDRSNDVLVSAASAWEISTKYRLGKLPDAGLVVANYEEHLATLGASEVSISSSHALLAGAFEVDHRDPFDRMIAAQAVALSMPVVTSDAAFGLFPCRVIW